MKGILSSAARKAAHAVATLVVPKSLSCAWRFESFAVESYSQEGEDLILRRAFGTHSNGFYVDVGAHHPVRFSNTYYFYRRGWRGINIDATPGSMKLFHKLRPRDASIEAFVSSAKHQVEFILFSDGALNGRSRNLSRVPNGERYRSVGSCNLISRRLDEILEQNLPVGQEIDFLSIDVEGYDFEVLISNDWKRFRPGYVLVEELGGLAIEEIRGGRSSKLLLEQGYELFAKTANTLIFRTKESAATGLLLPEGSRLVG